MGTASYFIGVYVKQREVLANKRKLPEDLLHSLATILGLCVFEETNPCRGITVFEKRDYSIREIGMLQQIGEASFAPGKKSTLEGH